MDLKTWRTKQGKSQIVVAELLGITQSHLSKLEKRTTEPSLDLARRINKHTKGAVTLDDMAKASR